MTATSETSATSLAQTNSTYLKNSPFDIGQFIFNNLPIGIFRSTPELEGKFLLANPACVKMLGYNTMDDILNVKVKEIYLNPADRTQLLSELQSQSKVLRKVHQYQKCNGDVFWGAVTVKIIMNELGDPLYIDGAIEDITEFKENEFKLIEERTFSDSIIEALPGMFWLNDENGRCVRWNKNVEQIYGYSPKELTQLHALKDVTSTKTLPSLMKAAEKALAGGSGYCEYELKTKAGTKISCAGDAVLVTINNKKYLSCVEIDISKRKEAEERLKEALEEINRLKDKAEAENDYLLDEFNSEPSSEFIVGRSKTLNQMLHTANKVAATTTTVLIQGETGTGKGLLAKYIHNQSSRRNRALIKLNCANLPPTLIESILFGHERGAFTDANASKIGRFELAHESTIFLDEIAELPLELQAKLLRVIEEGEFERLGSPRTITVDVRIIAATNRNLEEEVKAGNFRQDLLFRLNVYPITSPPLRERKSDIPLLVQFFINKFNKSLGKSISTIPNAVISQFEAYSWPGNIREFQNVIERAMINSTGESLDIKGVSNIQESSSDSTKKIGMTMREVECQHIVNTLELTNWVIEGEKGAAKLLDLNPGTLRGRMRKYGIQRPGKVTRF